MVRTHALQIWKLLLKNCRPDVHPHGSDARKPYKEISYSGRATVRTRLLNRKDFPVKFSENLVAQLSVRTGPRYILPDAHLSP
jgi:hypothetical protein